MVTSEGHERAYGLKHSPGAVLFASLVLGRRQSGIPITTYSP